MASPRIPLHAPTPASTLRHGVNCIEAAGGGPNRFSLQFCLSHKVVNECFAKPFILVAMGFDESPPVLVPHRRREGNPSALEVDEAGLVVIQEFRWHRAALVAILPDIMKFLGL